jgi:hypothetical protein
LKVLNSRYLYNDIRSMINNATSEILIVTDELSHGFAEELERKAISGVKMKVMSSDTEWVRWLENRFKSYGLDEEKRLEEDVKEISSALTLYKRIPFLVLTAFLALIVVELVRVLELDLLLEATLVTGVVATAFSSVYFRRKSKELEYEISLKQQELENVRAKIEDSRKRLSKYLSVVELSTKVNFSLIMADDKVIVTSMSLKYDEKESKNLDFVEEVSGDFVKSLVEKLAPG